MNYLDGLNTEQKEAVLHTEGPLLILAGAGAGKTKTLTHRILHLVKLGKEPSSILAITFTNKAAKEMRERVMMLLEKEHVQQEGRGDVPFVSTFHSLGVHILKQHGALIGLKRYFTIYDRNDSLQAIKEGLRDEGFDPKEIEPGKILGFISKEKGKGVRLEDFRGEGRREFFSSVVLRVWGRYEAALKKESAVDFDDLLLGTVTILKNHPAVLIQLQETWKYVHVDEYQDTNKVQYKMAELLAGKSRNICVVGDIDQNIYSWRGADIRNILDFERDYPEARTILLEENYRSTQTILATANTVIKKNKKRKEKNLFTKNGPGEKISLFEGYDETDEAHYVAATAKELGAKGVTWSEMAVLYRANFQSRALEEAFFIHEVPYQLLGTKFFDRKEVKDAISYLRLALNSDALGDLKRVVNVPPRGLGKVALLKILSSKAEELPATARKKFENFQTIIGTLKQKLTADKPSECIRWLIIASGMEAEYKDGTEDEQERLENLYELVTLAKKYDFHEPPEGIEKLLEDAALSTDQDELAENRNAVKLMTVHASKGLEFEHVFICGLEEDLFPHRFMGAEPSDDKDEEERRLFYVALTRAKKKLHLSLAATRTIFGSRKMNIPSEYLSDLDESLVESPPRPNEGKREKVIFFD